MTLYNITNIKSILLILLCLVILSILFCIVTSKFREGLDNTVGLTDFTHSDPNIKPTPLPDICIGNGNFISQPNSTIPVTGTAGYLHSNIGACENECTPERGCFAVSFDRASKDVMKKCNIYSGATSVGENTTKAGLLCSRISPTCSVGGYKLNNTSSDLATVIKPNGGETLPHSAEVWCAVECNNRADCIGYLYDNKSKDWLKKCKIFSKNKNGLSTGFPVAGICSRSLVSASYFNGTWQTMPCPGWSALETNKKIVFKVDGNKVEMTPLDPTLLSRNGKGNAIIDGDGISGSWANGIKISGVLKGNKIYWDKNCFYEKISSSTNIPQWHLAPVGSTTCDSGTSASFGECEAIVKSLATKNKHVPGRSMQVASGSELLAPCNDPTGWGNVPIGCSAQTGGDWAAHYKTGSVNCNSRGLYQLVCSGKAPPDSSAPSPGSPNIPQSYFNGTWQTMPCPGWSALETNKKIVFKVDGNKVEMTPLDPTLLSRNGKGNAIIDGDGISGSWANGIKISGVLKGNKIYWDKNCFYEKISSSTPSPGSPPPPHGTPPPPPGTPPEKPNTIIPIIPPDHPRQKRINQVLNTIIGTGAYQSPLPFV